MFISLNGVGTASYDPRPAVAAFFQKKRLPLSRTTNRCVPSETSFEFFLSSLNCLRYYVTQCLHCPLQLCTLWYMIINSTQCPTNSIKVGSAFTTLMLLVELNFDRSSVKHVVHFRILRIKMIATSGFLPALQDTRFVFGWGSAPDPAREAYDAPPDL